MTRRNNAWNAKFKSKVGYLDKGFDYLGYEFIGDKITVRKKSVHQLESRIARAFTAYRRTVEANKDGEAAEEIMEEVVRRCLREVNLLVTGFTFKRTERGWIQYYRQMNDYKLLTSLTLLFAILHDDSRCPLTSSHANSSVPTVLSSQLPPVGEYLVYV